MFSGTAQVSNQVCQFFVSSVCLLVRGLWWIKTRLSFDVRASHIGHIVIRKEEKKA